MSPSNQRPQRGTISAASSAVKNRFWSECSYGLENGTSACKSVTDTRSGKVVQKRCHANGWIYIPVKRNRQSLKKPYGSGRIHIAGRTAHKSVAAPKPSQLTKPLQRTSEALSVPKPGDRSHHQQAALPSAE